MALINCPECNKKISDKSGNCPQCGYPISEGVTSQTTEEPINMVPCRGCGEKIDEMNITCPKCGVSQFIKSSKSKNIPDTNNYIPAIGQEKKGDLRGVYVYKFKIKTTQYLLAYRFSGENLELIMIGQHENYYRDIKTYLKSRK